jgi:predicted oxidoreductase
MPSKLVEKVLVCPAGPNLSRFVQGYWRLADWHLTPQQRLSFVKQHLELGITSVDHASIYGSPCCEELFGEALAIDSAIRPQLQIVSKCGIYLENDKTTQQVSHYTSSKSSIIQSVEKSLTRLKTDYLDLLLLHRPDFLLNADEVSEAFVALRDAGKVNYFGVSNYSSSQFSLLQSRLDFPLVTNQVEINPLNMNALEDGTLDQMQQLRIRPMAWSVLAGGRLTSEQGAQVVRLKKTLVEVCKEIGADSIEQVMTRWVLELPSQPLVIFGTGKIKRIRSGLNSLQLNLSREQWYRIWVAAKGHSVP